MVYFHECGIGAETKKNQISITIKNLLTLSLTLTSSLLSDPRSLVDSLFVLRLALYEARVLTATDRRVVSGASVVVV